MTDGAETPPPATPETPTVESRLAQVEADLKDLARIGKEAYDGLTERLTKLESTPPTPSAPPADVPDVSRAPPGPVAPPLPGSDKNGWLRST